MVHLFTQDDLLVNASSATNFLGTDLTNDVWKDVRNVIIFIANDVKMNIAAFSDLPVIVFGFMVPSEAKTKQKV